MATDPLGLWFFDNIYVAKTTLWLTGGDESWLDNRPAVRRVSRSFAVVSMVCSSAALGLAIVGFDIVIWEAATQGSPLGPGIPRPSNVTEYPLGPEPVPPTPFDWSQPLGPSLPPRWPPIVPPGSGGGPMIYPFL